MNIGHLMRSLFGERTVGDARTLELKVGQVVRGVVVEVLNDSEAVIQIQGVQVRAKLETPLQAGQSALLHVEPQSSGSTIVFKQVDAQTLSMMDTSLKEVARQLGLPEERWALDIIKDLKLNQIPLQRATIQFYDQARALLPAGENEKQWLQAATLLLKRGLPPSATSIAAMQQVLFEQAPEQLMQQLRQLLPSAPLEAASTSQPAASKAESASYLPIASKVVALMDSLRMERGVIELEKAAPAPVPVPSAKDSALPQSTTLQQDQATTASRHAASDKHPLLQWMKLWGLDYESSMLKTMQPALAKAEQPANQAATPMMTSKPVDTAQSTQLLAREQQQVEQMPAPAASARNAAAAAVVESVVIVKEEAAAADAKQPSTAVDHSKQSQAALIKDHNGQLGQPSTTGVIASTMSVQDDIPPAETLKGLLMQLLASDAPPAVKDVTNQLLLQVTGQQLLLTAERNQALLSHITMMIPLHDDTGSNSATIHVQTRRSKAGQLDAENCRLIFHLTMQALGETMIDVNVANRLVSVQVANDHPIMNDLMQLANRTALADQFAASGYQLSGLMLVPLPPKSEANQEQEHRNETLFQTFPSTGYKGVDVKV